MKSFGKYAKYYDLIHRDKNYEEEVCYVEKLIKKYERRNGKNLLDIGCGTGAHALSFAQKGYNVYGVDLSHEMIRIAETRKGDLHNVKFQQANFVDTPTNKTFDIVTALFHVVSFQPSNEALHSFLTNAYLNLKRNGLFIFDFWYGPAVLSNPPQVKVKHLENEQIRLIRIVKPTMIANENVVKLDHEVIIFDKSKGSAELVKETHLMRYLFFPELEFILKDIGLQIVTDLEWMSEEKHLSFNCWSGTLVLTK